MSDSTKNSSNGGRALYYSGGASRAIYYGGSTPASYSQPLYGSAPIYGGGSAYYYGGPAGSNQQSEDAIFGQLSLMRIIRVCLQRWVTILVFVIIGFVLAYAVFKISPVIYESTAVIEMRMRGSTYTGLSKAVIEMDSSITMLELFNTRLARLRSRAVFEQVIAQYRADYPSSIATDEQLAKALAKSEMTLMRQSRLIQISIRSTDPQMATDLANAYAKVAESSTSDLNRNESEVAVAWLSATTEQMKRNLNQADKALLDFYAINQIDTMKRERETNMQKLNKITADLLALEGQITIADSLKKTLEAIQNEPEKFGSLPAAVTSSQEINNAYNRLQETLAEKNSLLARYTANHPEVRIKEKEVEIYRKQFADVVYRALETAKANLALLISQREKLTPKQEQLEKRLAELEAKIDSASVRVEQLEREREVADIQYKALLTRTSEAQLAADEDTAIIKPVESAFLPERPVLPNPILIFPAGVMGGLVLGFLFVMMLDHLEDKIVGIADIEERLRLKVLAVFPHVRRKKRHEIARIVSEDKFSQFAEMVASLRNLLDSPRYHAMTKVCLCMSTQPGEGKTISSCSIAQSYAQSGQKTLLVDFDLRRPRLANIFNLKRGEYKSLADVLTRNAVEEFDELPVVADVHPNLSVILSRASNKVNPSMIMGSDSVIEFFKWARERYDHIIIDSPPFGLVGDVMTLASLVDSVMIMCCPETTRFHAVKHAVRQLSEAGAHIIGVIVNDVDIGHRSQYARYNYAYSYRYREKYGYAPYAAKNADDGDEEKTSEKKPSDKAATPDEISNDDLIPKAAEKQDEVDLSMTDDD